ncbi:nicotinate (nicotinamide) nucleotide adenylyltransferase [Salinicoccus sp. HZC-1]|uniref:nicotinate (nicotinamide) nucleotide adenylyltransferase n=1 Tax=Salinicoccus sp. HZC-1 TaxID=3385497 RepID=UPI00398A723D
MKIAIFGGSFDPVHIGHVHAVIEAKMALDLDKIIFIPAKQAPLKTTSPTEDSHRLKMLQLAVREYDFIEIDNFELGQDGVSYTYETAKYLTGKYPDDEIYFLMGMDQYNNFEKWNHKDELLNMMKFAVMGRAAGDMNIEQPFVPVHQPVVEVSSTTIRERVAKGDIVRHQLNTAVYEYIKEQGLYEA